MSFHIRTAHLDHDARILMGRYHDGSTALVLKDAETGERLAKATVCMSESGANRADEAIVAVHQ